MYNILRKKDYKKACNGPKTGVPLIVDVSHAPL